MKTHKQTITREQREKAIRSLTWKKFAKYKLIELGIIPVCIFVLWQVPLLVGKAILKIFDNPTVHTFEIWFLGVIVSLIILSFLLVNWSCASENAREEINKKYPRRKKK